ncbi:putative transmembrane protein (fragment) [Ralstonia solanacearum CMR15]
MAFSNLYLLLAVCVAGLIGLASAPLVIRSARLGVRVLLTVIGVLLGLLVLEVLPVLT